MIQKHDHIRFGRGRTGKVHTVITTWGFAEYIIHIDRTDNVNPGGTTRINDSDSIEVIESFAGRMKTLTQTLRNIQ